LLSYFDALERRNEKTGYPTMSFMCQDFGGAGKPGHKILIADLPSRHRKTEAAIMSLPEEGQRIIAVKFGWFLDAKGTPVTNRQRAEFMGVGQERFRTMLRTAMRQLQRYFDNAAAMPPRC